MKRNPCNNINKYMQNDIYSKYSVIIDKCCDARRLSLMEIKAINTKYNEKFRANSLHNAVRVPFENKRAFLKEILCDFFSMDIVVAQLFDPMYYAAVEVNNIGMFNFSFSFDLDSNGVLAIYSNTSYKMVILDWFEDEEFGQILELSLFTDEIFIRRMQSLSSINTDSVGNVLSCIGRERVLIIRDESVRLIMHQICCIANLEDIYVPFLIIIPIKEGIKELINNEMKYFNNYITYHSEMISFNGETVLMIGLLPVMYGVTLYRGHSWVFDKERKAILAESEELMGIFTRKAARILQ